MAANQDTKLQVNFKLTDGTLVNLYATTQAELEGQIASIRDLAQQIIATSTLLNTRQAGFSAATQTIQDALGGQLVGTVPAAHQPAYQPETYDARSCKHGERVFRESKPGAPKAWKGYFCPSPKGTADQCEPNFVRG